MQFNLPKEAAPQGYVRTGFIDPGGTVDDYFFTELLTHIPTAHIQVTGAMHWLIDEANGVDNAKIRNNIAKLHDLYHYNKIGCELNNYGRGEVMQMRREYHINMYGINTAGRIKSEKIINQKKTMDKHQMVKWCNLWRVDEHITFPLPEEQSPEIKKIIQQLDSFVIKKTDGIAGPQFKYAAEGTQHDDGIMSLLGNLYIVKELFLHISGYDGRVAGGKAGDKETIEDVNNEEKVVLPGRTLGSISTSSVYEGLN